MILRMLLPFFMVVSLFAKGDTWQSNMDIKIEAGLFLSNLSGDISNTSSTTNFENDLNFDKSSASYFSLEYRLDYDYVPNFYISYYNMKDNTDSTLLNTKTIADEDYTSSVSSIVEYDSLSAIIYQDFLVKGKAISFLENKFYPGDIEFDIGINVKMLTWQYNIQDKTNLTISKSWITVNEFIPLPYFGFKYYRYNIILHGDISTLSFNRAKATSAQIALDYRLVSGLYLSCGYLYEKFDVVEDNDTVIFNASGIKFSFKYKF